MRPKVSHFHFLFDELPSSLPSARFVLGFSHTAHPVFVVLVPWLFIGVENAFSLYAKVVASLSLWPSILIRGLGDEFAHARGLSDEESELSSDKKCARRNASRNAKYQSKNFYSSLVKGRRGITKRGKCRLALASQIELIW